MQAFILNTEDKIKMKLDMLASLSQILIYSELMNENVNHPEMCDLDVKYLKLKCGIRPLEVKEEENWIKMYI